MNISEIDIKLTEHYRAYKTANGGKKTVADGKYGVKTLRYEVAEPDGTVHGPFLGRGKALNVFRTAIKGVKKPTEGVAFVVQEVYKPKAKDAPVEVRSTEAFLVTEKVKDAVTA